MPATKAALDLLIDGWQSDADSAAEWVDGGPGSGAQQCPAAILFNLDFAEISEIINDALPFRWFDAARGEPVHQVPAKHQGQKSAEDVTANGGICAVEDRPRGKQSLGSEKALIRSSFPICAAWVFRRIQRTGTTRRPKPPTFGRF
jgi:hypothetical protein